MAHFNGMLVERDGELRLHGARLACGDADALLEVLLRLAESGSVCARARACVCVCMCACACVRARCTS